MSIIIQRADDPWSYQDHTLPESIRNWTWLGRAASWWWVASNPCSWVGYAAASVFDRDTLFFGPTFVKPAARGLGLQLRLISERLAFASLWGAKRIVTVVDTDNKFSSNNLLKAGFKEFLPWPGADGRCFESVL